MRSPNLEPAVGNAPASGLRVAVLGATGSIGKQTLDVVRNCLEGAKIVLLTAGSNMEALAPLVDEFKPKYVAVSTHEKRDELRGLVKTAPEFFMGEDGISEAVAVCGSDVIVNALVGRVGLLPTIAAINSGTNVALANKETLVTAGNLVMGLAREKGVRVFPIDSEHSAIMQCLQGENPENVEKIILTASGGPFRTWEKERIAKATFRDALKHPNWEMGKKITIDSATMMNKGLELIEAMWLFGKTAEDIEIVVHPQSIIHSMVRFIDGSVSAVMGLPDMRLPILYALTVPNRVWAPYPKTDFTRMGTLSFHDVDFDKFPCLGLAVHAAKKGGCLPAVLNYVNEWAVHKFLQGKAGFYYISDVVARAMDAAPYMQISTVDDVRAAEEFANNFLRGEKIA